MLRKATMLLGALLLLAPAVTVYAQTEPTVVTVRQINAIPDENVSTLVQTGADLTNDQIDTLIFNDLVDQQVKFTAVVLSDPLLSGLASPRDDGNVGRVHIFVRDTSAVSQGMSGMGMQIVPGYPSYVEQGALNLQIGDVIDVVGTVSPFTGGSSSTMQFAPQTITVIGNVNGGGAYARYAPLIEPIELSTDDINRVIGTEQVQVNWDSLESINGQRVQIENATVLSRDLSNPDRPNWTITTDGGDTYVPIYDISLRYRNDRAGYPDPFQPRDSDDPFVPPPPGSVVNLTGFITYNGFDPVGRTAPEGALLSIAPFSDEDLQIVETPPIITPLARVTEVPGADPVEVTAYVKPDPSRTLGDVVLKYYTSADADTVTVTSTAVNDTTFTFSIPALDDEAFVTYWVEAEDNQGTLSESDDRSYRVLVQGINDIEDVQLTADMGVGDSPFIGITTDMNIQAVVQTDVTESGFLSVQDGSDPWSGIFVELSDAIRALNLVPGDSVLITSATVAEIRGDLNFGRTDPTTALADVTLEKTGSGDPIEPVVLTTAALEDGAIAEAHEGMLIRFENVVITNPNPAGPSNNFGEFEFATEDSEATLVADDVSAAIGSTYNVDTFDEGDQVEFVQGVLSYAFGTWRILPRIVADIGEITKIPVEEEELPGRYALDQNYPNPFNPSTTIRFEVARAGHVKLEVFDLLGRRVATLVDGQVAAGVQTVTFEARDLASGMYLYRLTAGAEVLTRTMVFLK